MARLRDHHRERTAEVIRRVAVDMAFEHGLDNVTTEMIAEKSGISARTFFNYFAFKEAALLPPPLEFSPEEVALFVAGTGRLLDDIIDLLHPRFAVVMLDKAQLIKAHEVAARHPKLLALRLNVFHQFDATLADLITHRLGPARSPAEVAQMAALISASIRVGFGAWADSDDGSGAEIISASIAAIQTLFDGI